jgi:hypothetical protein
MLAQARLKARVMVCGSPSAVIELRKCVDDGHSFRPVCSYRTARRKRNASSS